MRVEELRQGLAEAGRTDDLDVAAARATVGARATRRRRWRRRVAGVAAVAVIGLVTIPIALRSDAPDRSVHVAPSSTVEGWSVVQKDAAGLGTGTSFSALASTG